MSCPVIRNQNHNLAGMSRKLDICSLSPELLKYTNDDLLLSPKDKIKNTFSLKGVSSINQISPQVRK